MSKPNFTLNPNSSLTDSSRMNRPNFALRGDFGYSANTMEEYYQDRLKRREEELLRQTQENDTDSGESYGTPILGSPLLGLTKFAADLFNAGEDMATDDEYTGANGKQSTWAQQAKNINIRDALAVNLQATETEFMNAESKWLPEMDIAKQYLDTKQKILEQLASGSDTFETDIKAFNELESQVKELAKDNPYLRDIFYGDVTIPAFTKVGQQYPEKVSSSYISDIFDSPRRNDFENKKIANLSWANTNNELDDQTTASAKLQLKLDKLAQKTADLKDKYDDKAAEIKEKQWNLKNPHNLHLLGINTGIAYDPDLIDPKFDEERQNADMSILDPSSYKYGLTHLGSSMSEAQMMGATYATALAMKLGSKVIKNPYIWAFGEAAANLMSTKYFRNRETAAEVLSAYGEKLVDHADEFNIAQVMKDYEDGLNVRGIDTKGMDELELLQMGVAFRIPTSDYKYNQFAENARVGLTELEESNNALSLSDYAENFGLSYGAKVLKTGIKSEIKAAAKKGAGNLIARNAKVQKGVEALRHKIGNIADKVISNPAKKVATRRAIDAIGSFVWQTTKRTAMEGLEEGQQRVFQLRYNEKQVTPEAVEEPYSFSRGIVEAATGGVEAFAAYYGLHSNDMYNTDDQLKQAVSIGSFVGGVMGGAGHIVFNINHTRKQIKSDLSLTEYAAEQNAKAENSFKVAQFLDSYRKGNNSTYLRNSLESLKKYKGEGATDQMIDEDISTANLVYSIYKNKAIKPNLKELGIDREEGDAFEMFVQNQVDLVNRLKENTGLLKEADNDIATKIDALFNNESDSPLNTILKQQYEQYKQSTENPVDFNTYRTPVVNALVTRATDRVLNRLYKDISNRKKTLEQIAKEYGIETNTQALIGLQEYIKQARKDNNKALKDINKKMFEGTMNQLEDPAGIEELEELIGKSVLLGGLGQVIAVKNQAYATGRLPIKYRYLVQRKPLFNNLDATEQANVLNEYAEKWKKAHNTDQDPTRKQVIAYYNQKVQSDWASLETNANVEGNERTLANSIISEDLRNTRKSKQKGIEENREQAGVEPESTETPEPENPIDEPPTPPTPPAPAEPAAGNDNVDTAAEESTTPTPINDQVDREEGEPTPAPDEASAEQGVDDLMDRVSDEDYIDDGTIEIDRRNPQQKSQDAATQEVQDTQDADTEQDDDNAVSEDELRAKIDGIEEGEPIVDTGAITETSSEEEPASTVSVEEVPVEEPEGQKEPTKPATPKEKGREVIVHPESYDGSTNMEVPVPLEDDNTAVYSNGEEVWVGNEDPSVGTQIPAEHIEMQGEFDLYDADDKGTEAVATLGQSDKSPGLDSKKKVELNRIHSTFFYAFNSAEVMPIVANGKPVIFNGERRPGAELAKKLVQPGWLAKQKAYYIVTDSEETRKTERDAADRLTVHLIIEEKGEDGKTYIYNLALYTPDKAAAKMRSWTANTDHITKEVNQLRELRKSIISKFIAKYAPDYFTNQNTKLPQVAQKGIVPVNLRQSNGSVNTQKGEGDRPIYRSLTSVAAFGLSDDPTEMSRQITEGEVEFGMGKGPFALEAPFAIYHFDNATPASQQGVGYAGKIYLVPKVEDTPSQRNSAPIMLAEKRHFVPGGSKHLVTSYTPSGKAKYDDNGKRIPLTSAELIFRLITDTLHLDQNLTDDILNILVNHGPSTVAANNDSVKLSFYIRKSLHTFSNSSGTFLMYAQRVEGGKAYRLKYLKVRDSSGKIVFTDDQAYEVIRQLSNNLHWNTDKEMMLQPIPESIVKAAIEYMNRYNVDYYRVLNCDDLVFTMKDLNLKRDSNGKVVKAGDTPILMSWMINHEVLKTDVGDTPFRAPFVYADDAVATDAPIETQQKPVEPIQSPSKQSSTSQTQDNTTEQQKPVKTPENVSQKGKFDGYKVLSIDEAKAAGLTPREGFTYVTKPDGSHVALPNSSKVLSQIKGVYSTVKGEGKVDIEAAKKWLHETLGIDPDDVMVTNAVMKAVNAPQVYGLLQAVFDRIHDEFAARITLSTESGRGVEFHEAWHYVSLLLLNEATRNQVYSDFVKRNPQYANSTKQEVEEALAEEFRAYMLNETNPSLGYRVRKFFRAVWNLVSKMAGRKLNLQSQIFNDIRKGKFKDAQLDQATLEEFSKAYGAGIGYYAPGISDEEQKKIPHITNANTLYNIVESLSSTSLALLDIKSMDDIKKLSLDEVFDTIQSMYDLGEYDENEVKKQIVSDVLLNKNLFGNQIRMYLQELGVKAIEREETRIAEEEAKDSGDTADNIWDRASYEISKKANVAFNAKLFFYSLPKSKFATDENGNQVLTTVKDNIFGLDVVQPFDVTWNKILDNLWESNDWDDLLRKTRNLAKADPFFATLLNKLDNPAYPLPENTVTQILTTIQSAKNSMDTIQITDLSRANKTAAGRGKYMWSVRNSNNLRKIARLPSKWSQNFLLSSLVIVDENGRSRIDTRRFAELSRLDKDILKGIKEIGAKLNNKRPEIRQEGLNQFEQTKQKFLNLLNSIGIPFDNEALDYLLKSSRTNVTDNPEFFVFKSLYSTVPGAISNSVISNIRAMNNSKSLEAKFKNVVISAPRIFNYKRSYAPMNLLAIAYGTTHPTPEEFSVTGADGSLIYPITQNNYMSDQLRWLNTNAHGKLDNLARSPYSANSLIVKALTGKDKPKLKLHTLIAINDDLTNSSRKYFEITPLEDYITKLTLINKGRLILPTMSDKPTWYSISGIKLPKDFLRSVRYAHNMEGEIDIISQDYRFSDETLSIFRNYFLDEYNAIVQYFNTKPEVEKSKSRYYDNYHGKIGRDGKMQPGGQGGRFRYFNRLPIDGEWVSLNQMIDAAERSGDDNLVTEALNQIREKLIDNQELLDDALNTLLLDKVDKEIKNAIKLGVISRDENGQLMYGNLPATNELLDDGEYNIFSEYEKAFGAAANDQYSQQDIIYSMIANFVTGYAISIEEVEKCFTGDPAFYKWKSNEDVGIFQRDVDKIKRLSSVLSTGTNLRTNWGPNDVRNSTKFTSAVMADNLVGSDYHGRLLEIFRADTTRTMLKRNNPALTDAELFYLTKDDAIEATLANRKLLSEADVTFINKAADKAAEPYAYDEDKNTGNVNQADAAVYIRPAMYKRIMQALGEWSPEIERAYNLLESNSEVLSDPDVYARALKASIKPLKMVYFGDSFDGVSGVNVPTYDKMALFPMFKILCTVDNKALYDRMNDEKLGVIDMLAFESAVKVGSPRDKLRVYKDNHNKYLNTEAINTPSSMRVNYAQDSATERMLDGTPVITTRVQDISQLRLQLSTEPEAELERSFGTQAVKICLGNVVDKRSYGENKGLSVTGEQIKKDVFGCIKALSSQGHQKLLDRFFNKNGTINTKALSDHLVKEARGTNMSAEIIEALQGNIPIASLSVRNWIESKIVSLINKEVIDVNTPGGSAIQMPFFGFGRTQIFGDSAAATFNDGNKLSFDPDKGSMEIMLSAKYFKDVVPKVLQKDHVTMRNWLIDHGIIGPDAKPYGIGYRIPTQGLSSTISFVVADILPDSLGDVVVVPDEFTAMTGSDFDIDHLYLATYKYDEEGNRYEFDDTKDYIEQTTGALVNKLLDSYTLVISDSKTMAETRASIDTLTSILKKEILPLVQSTELKEAEPMYELMPSFQEARKTEYSSGKAGIAPFALNSTNHCLTQATHLRMRYSDSAKKYNLGDLDAIDSQDEGRYRILDWLSAMINAHVDVAKDPYILSLNVNQVTYNMTNFLLRTGKGRTTFLFMAQPIIKEYVDQMIANNGVVGVNKHTERQIISDVRNKYTNMIASYLADAKNKKAFDEWMDDRGNLAFSDNDLIRSLEGFKNKNADELDIIQQLIVLKAYEELSKDAQRMSDLVQRSQIDTKKYGNSLSQLQNFYNSYNTFIEDNQDRFYTDKVENNGLVEYFNDTFLNQKLMSALSLANGLLKGQVFAATDGYKEALTSVLQNIRGGNYSPINNGNGVLYRYRPTTNKQFVGNLSSKLESIVRAKVVADSANLRLTDEEINSLLFGGNSIAHQLNNIKSYIRQHKDDVNLMTFVDEYGNITNELLNYLQAVTSNNKRKVSYIETATSSMNNSRYYEDRLKSAFYDLLYSEDATIKKFADNLVKYAFLTSYDNRNPHSFFNLVPTQYRRDTGYVNAITNALTQFNNGDTSQLDYNSMYLSLVRNYYKDNDIVPVVVRKVYANGGSNVVNYSAAPNKQYQQTATVVGLTGNYELSQDYRFFKIISTANGNTEVYQRYGDIVDAETGKTVERVYTLVPKLGFEAGSRSVYELYKEGNEASAFEQNQFTEKMTQQINDVDNAIAGRISRRKKQDLIFVKSDEYQAAGATVYHNVDEEVSDFVNVTIDENDPIVTTPEEADLDLTSPEAESVISLEDLTPAEEIIDSAAEVEEIIDSTGETDTVIKDMSTPEQDISDLAELGKQRKEECK